MSYSPEKNKQYLKERYRRQRDDFLGRLGGVCARCGSAEELEFDHIDPMTKSFGIAGLWPVKRLPEVYEELKKCQLLCDTCHNEKSAQESSIRNSGFTHGTMYGWMNKKCCCDPCTERKREWYDERNARRRKLGGRGPYRKRSRPN